MIWGVSGAHPKSVCLLPASIRLYSQGLDEVWDSVAPKETEEQVVTRVALCQTKGQLGKTGEL